MIQGNYLRVVSLVAAFLKNQGARKNQVHGQNRWDSPIKYIRVTMIALNNFQTGVTSIRWRKRCTIALLLLLLVPLLVLLLVLANILLEHTHTDTHTHSLSHSPSVSLLHFLLSNLAFYAQSTSMVISLLYQGDFCWELVCLACCWFLSQYMLILFLSNKI